MTFRIRKKKNKNRSLNWSCCELFHDVQGNEDESIIIDRLSISLPFGPESSSTPLKKPNFLIDKNVKNSACANSICDESVILSDKLEDVSDHQNDNSFSTFDEFSHLKSVNVANRRKEKTLWNIDELSFNSSKNDYFESEDIVPCSQMGTTRCVNGYRKSPTKKTKIINLNCRKRTRKENNADLDVNPFKSKGIECQGELKKSDDKNLAHNIIDSNYATKIDKNISLLCSEDIIPSSQVFINGNFLNDDKIPTSPKKEDPCSDLRDEDFKLNSRDSFQDVFITFVSGNQNKKDTIHNIESSEVNNSIRKTHDIDNIDKVDSQETIQDKCNGNKMSFKSDEFNSSENICQESVITIPETQEVNIFQSKRQCHDSDSIFLSGVEGIIPETQDISVNGRDNCYSKTQNKSTENCAEVDPCSFRENLKENIFDCIQNTIHKQVNDYVDLKSDHFPPKSLNESPIKEILVPNNDGYISSTLIQKRSNEKNLVMSKNSKDSDTEEILKHIRISPCKVVLNKLSNSTFNSPIKLTDSSDNRKQLNVIPVGPGQLNSSLTQTESFRYTSQKIIFNPKGLIKKITIIDEKEVTSQSEWVNPNLQVIENDESEMFQHGFEKSLNMSSKPMKAYTKNKSPNKSVRMKSKFFKDINLLRSSNSWEEDSDKNAKNQNSDSDNYLEVSTVQMLTQMYVISDYFEIVTFMMPVAG